MTLPGLTVLLALLPTLLPVQVPALFPALLPALLPALVPALAMSLGPHFTSEVKAACTAAYALLAQSHRPAGLSCNLAGHSAGGR